MKNGACLALVFALAACGVPDEAEKPSGPPVEVTVKELFSAYQENEAAAQQKYGNSPLKVSGKVASVDLDFSDEPVVMLETSNEFMNAQASLTEAGQQKAPGLNKGQDIVLLCASVSEVIGTPMLADCEIP